MKINLLSVLFLSLVLCYSCNNTSGNNQPASSDVLRVEFDSLAIDPENFLGKNLAVEGKVVFVCPSCGKKLKITGSNPDVNLVVEAGELGPKFSTDLLGTTIEVEGMIVKSGAVTTEDMHCTKADTCSGKEMAAADITTEKAAITGAALSGIIMDYRNHTVR